MRWLFATFLLCLLLLTGYVNAAINKEARLKEKIGQMLLIGFQGTELTPTDPIVQAILTQRIGGVILYASQTPSDRRNITNPTQLKNLTQQLQDYTKQAAKNNNNEFFPLLIGVDYEGGKVTPLKQSKGFPATISAASLAQGTLAEAEHAAQQMARTLADAGINLNFAPILDVNVNPENPVIGKFERSFSRDPKRVAEYAAIFARAYQEHGIICTYKHFPGHGSSSKDTHRGFVDVTPTWQAYELEPYKALVNKSLSCPMVMTAHVVHYGLDSRGYPASISHAMTQELLRTTLNFTGVVITDDLQMRAITDNYGLAESVKLAVNAGADILLFANQLATAPQDPAQIIDLIYADVKAGEIREDRIEEAYQRIIELKKKIKQLP